MAKQDWSKEELIAQIQKCAERLGHCPSIPELNDNARITLNTLRKNFGTYSKALVECGLERKGPGYKVELMDLFTEWAEMVRGDKAIPTLAEYSLRSQYSPRPLLTRFGGWKYVPKGMQLFAEQERLEERYQDILEIIKASIQARLSRSEHSGSHAR